MSLAKRILSIITIISVSVMLAGGALPARAEDTDDLAQQLTQLQQLLQQLCQSYYDATGEVLAGCEGYVSAEQPAPSGEWPAGIPEGFRFEKNLKYGMSDPDVKYLQILLNTDPDTKVAETGAGSPGNETQYFGPRTKAAVIKFQEKYADDVLAPWGLTHGTGFVGSTTRAKLNEILESLETTPPAPTPSCSDYTTQEECENAGCYWYDEACHEEEQPAPTVGEGLTVELADDTPAAAYLVRDTGAVVAQARADFVKFVFTNGDSEDVTVTTLKLKRTGISADSDLSNVYLYDGDTKIAEYTSFSNQVITFTDADGLFTIPAGGSKEITVKADISPANASVASIILGIESADDIVSNASSVNGDFPLRGNAMAVTTVTDLGYVNISNYTTYPSSVDPGVTDYELWRFSVTAHDQDMQIEKIVLTMVGTIDRDDVQNLKLEIGGIAVSSTVNIDENNKVVFDLSADPIEISKGQTKIIVLKGDVPTGTGRSFKFTIRKADDFVVKDTQYGVYVAPLVGGSAFTVVEPTSGAGTSINTGSLTVSVCSDSPSGNVAAGAANVPLARFCFKANGEDIKISYLDIKVDNSQNVTMDNGKLYYNGSQVGTTDVSVADNTTNTFSLGNAVIIPAGETGVFEYRADITTGGSALSAGTTIVVYLESASNYAMGQSSLQYIAISGATGRTLTVASGALSVAKNTAMADYTTSLPTGVKGATDKKVGSFVITAGAGEGVTITQIVVGDDADVATSDFGANFQNLRLMHGDTQLGTTIGTLSSTEGADYTFNISPAITLSAGEQYVVDIYADILSGATGYSSAEVGLEVVSVSATGNTTGQDASWSGDVDLQKLVIATSGSLTITAVPAPSTPVAGQLVMGSTENTFVTLSFTAGAAEDIQVTRIKLTDTTNFPGSLSNIKLIDVATGEQVGPTVAALDSNGYAEFNLSEPWVIPAGATKYLKVVADVNAYPNAVSGGSHTISLASASDIDSLGVSSGVSITETVAAATSSAQDVYKTKVTVAKNASSPSGSAVAGANSEVLRFDVTADSAGLAYFSAVALTISGSVDVTGNGNAYLYDASDLTTPLATESYKALVFEDHDATDNDNEYTFQLLDDPDEADGIPVGATVRIYDASASSYLSGTFVVTAIEVDNYDGDNDDLDVKITLSPTPSTDLDNGDILYYRPLQPGSGKLYFGAHTTLTANVAETANSLSVSSINGFATGDTITVKGYLTDGTLVTKTATIKALSGTTITLDSAIGDMNSDEDTDDTLDFDYLNTVANALEKKHISRAIVYSGTSLTGSIGDIISAGGTVTYVVKGDTTGATTGENLRVDINSASDFIWSDGYSWTINTDTQSFPVTGGTLTY